MRKNSKIIRMGLATLLLLTGLAGCGPRVDNTSDDGSSVNIPKGVFQRDSDRTEELDQTAESSTDTHDLVDGMTESEALKVYSSTLDYYCNTIIDADTALDTELKEGANWLYDILPGNDPAMVLSNVGYQIKDISGDGVPELLIGDIESDDDYNEYGSFIFSLYTIVNGKPQCSAEGWSRSSYRMMNNGQLFYEGSGGAMYGIYGIYDLSKDGTELICKDYYFTASKDDNYEEIVTYHNTTGEGDASVSEEMDIPLEDFWEMADKSRKETYKLTLTPLKQYALDQGMDIPEGNESNPSETNPEGASDVNSSSVLEANWMDDSLNAYTQYDEYNVGQNADGNFVLFTTNETITDVKLLALTFKDVTQDGNLIFDEEVLYTAPQLTKDHPFVAGLEFFGSIPNNGISYVDSQGNYHRYTIEMSGMDGSLLLTEY